jgi:hypothetical protein
MLDTPGIPFKSGAVATNHVSLIIDQFFYLSIYQQISREFATGSSHRARTQFLNIVANGTGQKPVRADTSIAV